MGIAGVDMISENAPRRILASDLGAPNGTRFVHAACGKNHTLLVGSDGQVWSAGMNNTGQVVSFVAIATLSHMLTCQNIVRPSSLPGDHLFQGHQWTLQWGQKRTCDQSRRGQYVFNSLD